MGRLYPLHRGVYAVGHRPVSPYARALAAVLACGAGAVLSHGSAATLWGIAKTWRGPLEVTARSEHRHPGLVIHRSGALVRRDRTFHFGIPVTTPSRTLLDMAARLDDVALARAVNDLRLARYLSLTEFAECMARHPGRRGAKRLRRFLAHPTRAPTRSEFEDAFLLFAERHGLPEPEVNTRVAGHEVDLLFRGAQAGGRARRVRDSPRAHAVRGRPRSRRRPPRGADRDGANHLGAHDAAPGARGISSACHPWPTIMIMAGDPISTS